MKKATLTIIMTIARFFIDLYRSCFAERQQLTVLPPKKKSRKSAPKLLPKKSVQAVTSTEGSVDIPDTFELSSSTALRYDLIDAFIQHRKSVDPAYTDQWSMDEIWTHWSCGGGHHVGCHVEPLDANSLMINRAHDLVMMHVDMHIVSASNAEYKQLLQICAPNANVFSSIPLTFFDDKRLSIRRDT